MDPFANITEQRDLAVAILNAFDHDDDAQRLAELVIALDEWRKSGGFDPYVITP